MSDGPPRTRASTGDQSDQWLIEAARKAGHQLPNRERTPGTTAWRMLLNAGVTEDEVLRLACTESRAEAADFSQVTPAMSTLLPHLVARAYRVVPLGLRKNVLLVATSDPKSIEIEREISHAAKRRVELHAGSPSEIVRAQSIVYGAALGVSASSRMVTLEPDTLAAAPQPVEARVPRLSLSVSAPAVPASEPAATAPLGAKAVEQAVSPLPSRPDETLADRLFATALTDLASEVILEPAAGGGVLARMRIDGAMHDRFRISADRSEPLIASLKKGAALDPATTTPAQGTATFKGPSGPLVVRVRTQRSHPSSGDATTGERVLLRLCYSRGLVGLAELGYSLAELHRLRALLSTTGGLVVVAGPPGAGKTATLYAAARELCQLGRLVSTVEETVEYPLAGITQLRLREGRRGLGAALKAASGSTDDIVSSAIIADATLDASTFELSAEAAGRGQLVVASLEAPDLTATFAALRALHPDGGPLASALRGVVAQRLVRRLCAKCASPQVPSELPALERRLLEGLPTGNVRRPVGCDECRGTGYRGRMAIVEVVSITSALHDAMARRAVAAELVHLARKEGLPSLWDSGIQHVLAGSTSLAEVLDAVPPPESFDASDDFDALLSEALSSPRPRR
ncbi:MAG TPA: ATPase, T2SS/T4P/T4SS family [Gemmatimonadaceae bacterium]|nr:ATPase, T2SS/T4P/T4SS family [Gemmatimonadaceae bacterium]